MSYGHYPSGPSPLSTINFDDIRPVAMQLHFREIHDALKPLSATLAENAVRYLRLAADSYATAWQVESQFKRPK